MNIPIVRQSPPNPCAATENRETFDALGLVCVNLVGPAGCGKTVFLEAVLPRLRKELRVGVIEGDLAVTCDAQRIEGAGVPVVQVLSDGRAYLEAHQVQRGLVELPLSSLDLVIVENLGSVVYPAGGFVGEHVRATMFSVSDGDLVVEKYPSLVCDAQLVLLSKYSLLPQVDFDLDETVRRIRRANPAAELICTDTRTRVGIDRAAGWLLGYARAQRVRRQRCHRLAEPLGALR